MTYGEIAFLALVLGAFAIFVIGAGYAYASSWQVRRAKTGIQQFREAPTAGSTQVLRKAA